MVRTKEHSVNEYHRANWSEYNATIDIAGWTDKVRIAVHDNAANAELGSKTVTMNEFCPKTLNGKKAQHFKLMGQSGGEVGDFVFYNKFIAL